MSPACRATGLALAVAGAVEASAYVVTPLVLGVLVVLFLASTLITWLVSLSKGGRTWTAS